MSMVTTCTELYYSFIKMCLHFKKHWVFIKRCGKYGRMVVNFYEEEDKKNQALSRSNFHLVSNPAQWGNTFKNLREEIILLSTRRLPL